MSGAAQGNAAQGIAPANGKLGVMIPGMGAVATTLIAGVEAVRRGLAQPVGSLTQMDTLMENCCFPHELLENLCLIILLRKLLQTNAPSTVSSVVVFLTFIFILLYFIISLFGFFLFLLLFSYFYFFLIFGCFFIPF